MKEEPTSEERSDRKVKEKTTKKSRELDGLLLKKKNERKANRQGEKLNGKKKSPLKKR